MPIEQLVQHVCNMKQSFTQHGGTLILFLLFMFIFLYICFVFKGMRPYGVSFLYAGWDRIYGYQLYQSDPSGNYGGWKATCIGGNLNTAQSIFKTDYSADMDLEEVKKLAVKVLSKTIEATNLNHERLEVSILTHKSNKTEINILSFDQVDSFVKSYAPAPEKK